MGARTNPAFVPRVMHVGKFFLDLAHGQTFELSERTFKQTRVGNNGEPQRSANQNGSAKRALQGTGINRVERAFAAHARREPPRLFQTAFIQFNIGVSLNPSFRIPLRFAVTYQIQFQHALV